MFLRYCMREIYSLSLTFKEPWRDLNTERKSPGAIFLFHARHCCGFTFDPSSFVSVISLRPRCGRQIIQGFSSVSKSVSVPILWMSFVERKQTNSVVNWTMEIATFKFIWPNHFPIFEKAFQVTLSDLLGNIQHLRGSICCLILAIFLAQQNLCLQYSEITSSSSVPLLNNLISKVFS